MTKAPRKRRTLKNRPTGAPTIADVAALAGVSMMTVSRVINAEPKVREATREAVNAAIAQLNYAPNRAARSLAGAALLRLGLLHSNPSEAYLSALLVGSLDQASRLDVLLSVQNCEPMETAIGAAERMVAGGIDGLILPPPLCELEPLVDTVRKLGVPTVAIATARPLEGVAAVMIDDRAAAREMTAHLVSLGHRRIGFIAGHPNLSASDERLAGYREALEQGGIGFDPQLVVPGLFSYRSGLDGAEKLLDLEPAPTAIFAANDDMAAATVAVAHRRGLDVPSDLTVCGFDDSTLATRIWPELTTVHQPIGDMGREAVALLVSMLRGSGEPDEKLPHVKLDHGLIRRQSDAAPRRRPKARD